MEEVCFSYVSRPEIRPCRRCLSQWGWQAFSVWCVSFLIQFQKKNRSFSHQEESSHRFIKTRSTIIAISGVSTLLPTAGIGSTPRYARVRDPDIGGCNYRFMWLFLNLCLIRMAVRKHYIILFGGFYDPGIITTFSHLWKGYLNTLQIFDTRDTSGRPSSSKRRTIFLHFLLIYFQRRLLQRVHER